MYLGGGFLLVQVKKGIMELVVLSLLMERDMYGYELVEEISNYIDISEGTIYPLLRRISKEDYVTTYLKESSSGPPRKYYSISQKGIEAYGDQLKNWQEFTQQVNNLLRRD